jgi:hypothetical protein
MPRYPLPQWPVSALVHGHCHHTAIMKMAAEERVLRRMGVNFQVLDSGCCGMAGAFGFEKKHYEISLQCGERVLLPAVRGADEETVIVANGFSCREQIAQTTPRAALHLAQVLALAYAAEAHEAASVPPERRFAPPPGTRRKRRRLVMAAAVFAVLLVAVVAWLALNGRAGAKHGAGASAAAANY